MNGGTALGSTIAAMTLAVACSSSDGAAPDSAASDSGVAVDGAPSGDAARDANDGGGAGDAAIDSAMDGASTQGCGEFAGDTRFTCSKDGNARGKCPGDASLTREACARGCLKEPPAQDDVCMGTTTSFSCTGSYGTTKADNGDYYITAFGCWVDAANVVHTDPADNCIPSCLDKARQSGLCLPGDTGPQCEERVTWYTADGARFGCLARLRVTNPANGKAVIAVALDYGPGCPGENGVSHAVLDASGRIDRYLFGADQGATDRALVHVVEVDSATPLGPVP
jgi:hypothetical protein